MATLNTVSSYDKAETETEVAAGELGTALGLMQTAAGEIRAIDLQLLHLALNARVQAAHLGPAGAMLGVLAGALHELARKSHQRSDVVAETLHSMNSAVLRLSGEAEHSASAKVRAYEDAVVSEMRSTIRELHSWSEANFIRIKETAALSSRLCEEITTAQGGFAAGAAFTDVANRCSRKLTLVAAGTGPTASEEGPGAGIPGLEDLAEYYSMQAERDVHAAVTLGANTESGRGRGGAVSIFGHEEAKELGDNVELF
jgi:hypothetical protein